MAGKSTIKCAECEVRCNLPVNPEDPTLVERSQDAWLSFCVDCKKVLCRRCVGRTHVRELTKRFTHVFEEIDWRHTGRVQQVATSVINMVIAFWAVYALLTSDISDSYFRGENICPLVSTGRRWLVWADVNLFHWWKPNISTFCDLEDSYWRLFMDGWVRGVVTGTDSWLLLFTTIQKALLFKVVAAKLLVPICAIFYALLATFLTHVLLQIEGWFAPGVGGQEEWFVAFLKTLLGRAVALNSGPGKKLVDKAAAQIDAWNKFICGMSRRLFKALCYTGVLRLVVRYFGLRFMPQTWKMLAPNANTWQLMFEPVFFWQLAKLMVWIEKTVPIYLPKKGILDPTEAEKRKGSAFKGNLMPITKRNDTISNCMNMNDQVWLDYQYELCWRMYEYYRGLANNIVVLLCDDVFNTIVLLRLLCVPLAIHSCAKVVAGFLSNYLGFVSLQALLDVHADWFYVHTGMRQDQHYLSDSLFLLMGKGMYQVGGFGFFRAGLGALLQISALWSLLWRALVPGVSYYLLKKWDERLAAQKGAFMQEWKGTGYAACQAEIGRTWTVN